MKDEKDLLVAADAINCLEDGRWGIISMEQRGVSFADGQYSNDVMRLMDHSRLGPFPLLFISMRRVPDGEKLSWELYREVVKTRVEKLHFEKDLRLPVPDDVSSRAREAMVKYHSIFRGKWAHSILISKHFQKNNT